MLSEMFIKYQYGIRYCSILRRLFIWNFFLNNKHFFINFICVELLSRRLIRQLVNIEKKLIDCQLPVAFNKTCLNEDIYAYTEE